MKARLRHTRLCRVLVIKLTGECIIWACGTGVRCSAASIAVLPGSGPPSASIRFARRAVCASFIDSQHAMTGSTTHPRTDIAPWPRSPTSYARMLDDAVRVDARKLTGLDAAMPFRGTSPVAEALILLWFVRAR